MISARRDTSFRFLPMLWPGDRLPLDGPRGGSDYQVIGSRIIARRQARIPAADSIDGRWLVTSSYPFDAIVSGAPLRHVVQARRMNLNMAATKSSTHAGTNVDRPGQTS